MGGYQGPTICHSWPAGCFPTENDLWFTYSPKEVREKAEKETKDLYTLAQSFGNEMASRIEVNAWLRPHPYLVENVDGKCVDVTEESAKVLEKTPTYLAYQKGDEESASLNMIFGPRTCQEEETLNLDHPAKNLAPVVSVELIVSGPPAEVAALKEKISRKAFEALLGPLVK